jgi:protein MPE1
MAMNMPMMGMPPMGMPPMGFQQPNMGYNMGFAPQQGFNMGGYGMPMMGGNQMNQQAGWMQPGMQMNMNMNGQMNGQMNMQQQNDAYERQPVNNRNRKRGNRAPDYRYL